MILLCLALLPIADDFAAPAPPTVTPLAAVAEPARTPPPEPVVAESPVVDSAVVDSAVVDSAVVDSAVVDSAVVDSAVVDSAVVEPLAAAGREVDARADEERGRWLEKYLPEPGPAVAVMVGPVRDARLLLPEKVEPLVAPLMPPLRVLHEVLPKADVTPDDVDRKMQAKLLGKNLLGSRSKDTDPAEAVWDWELAAGGSFRQGTTTNNNFHADFDFERHSRQTDFTGSIGAILNQNGGDDPNRRLFGSATHDRNLRGPWLFYARDESEYDEVRQIDFRTVASAGLGYRFLDLLDRRWVVRTGPSLQYVNYDNVRAMTDDSFDAGWFFESDYRRAFSETVRFELVTTAFPDFSRADRFRVRNVGAFVFPIGGRESRWNWKVGLRHEYQIEPVDEVPSTDVQGYFAVGYTR